MFVAATYLEQLGRDGLAAYGWRSLHEQSHGEGFLAIMIHRFRPNGLYLLDEPEAALSTLWSPLRIRAGRALTSAQQESPDLRSRPRRVWLRHRDRGFVGAVAASVAVFSRTVVGRPSPVEERMQLPGHCSCVPRVSPGSPVGPGRGNLRR